MYILTTMTTKNSKISLIKERENFKINPWSLRQPHMLAEKRFLGRPNLYPVDKTLSLAVTTWNASRSTGNPVGQARHDIVVTITVIFVLFQDPTRGRFLRQRCRVSGPSFADRHVSSSFSLLSSLLRDWTGSERYGNKFNRASSPYSINQNRCLRLVSSAWEPSLDSP